jgi:hypothetical protein
MPPNRPRLKLADVMILVGTSGFSLSTYILLDNGLFNGNLMASSSALASRSPLSGPFRSSRGGGDLAPMHSTGWAAVWGPFGSSSERSSPRGCC